MKVKQAHEYSQDVDTVFASFHDEEFIKAKMAAIGARNVNIESITQSGDTVNVKLTREMPAEAPSALKKFVKDWNKLTQTEVWMGSAGGPYTCSIKIDIDGVPVGMQGKMKLSATGSGSVNNIDMDIKSGIPIVGGTLAKFVGQSSEKAMQDEYNYISQNL
ncbi:MAG: DUF2505 domain-containing protein [Anaerolineae bacterium]|nr:DUF2505 domain-containing protein [Anaerolineae bacterium]MCO5192665.1 DUF2505 domain-containing protein [Anaerolineae bacterium]MCO5197823.1 DUF2505 domain-containing protein [Anaerolineae bacterium]MCO5205319.1 DUF2505 domain-containing protein [Anaerolineae bacterium]